MLFSNAGKLTVSLTVRFDILNCHLALSRLKVSIIFVTNRYNGEVLLFTLYMTCFDMSYETSFKVTDICSNTVQMYIVNARVTSDMTEFVLCCISDIFAVLTFCCFVWDKCQGSFLYVIFNTTVI